MCNNTFFFLSSLPAHWRCHFAIFHLDTQELVTCCCLSLKLCQWMAPFWPELSALKGLTSLCHVKLLGRWFRGHHVQLHQLGRCEQRVAALHQGAVMQSEACRVDRFVWICACENMIVLNHGVRVYCPNFVFVECSAMLVQAMFVLSMRDLSLMSTRTCNTQTHTCCIYLRSVLKVDIEPLLVVRNMASVSCEAGSFCMNREMLLKILQDVCLSHQSEIMCDVWLSWLGCGGMPAWTTHLCGLCAACPEACRSNMLCRSSASLKRIIKRWASKRPRLIPSIYASTVLVCNGWMT